MPWIERVVCLTTKGIKDWRVSHACTGVRNDNKVEKAITGDISSCPYGEGGELDRSALNGRYDRINNLDCVYVQ